MALSDRFKSLDLGEPEPAEERPAPKPRAKAKKQDFAERLFPPEKVEGWFKQLAQPLDGALPDSFTPGRRAQTITLTNDGPFLERQTYALSTTIENPCLLRSAQVSDGFALDQIVINRRFQVFENPAHTMSLVNFAGEVMKPGDRVDVIVFCKKIGTLAAYLSVVALPMEGLDRP